MAKFTLNVDPRDLIFQIYTKDSVGLVLDCTSRHGFPICREHVLSESPDFLAEFGELLRPVGLELDSVPGSLRSRLEDTERLLAALKSSQTGVVSSGAEPHELPALAARIAEGEHVDGDDVSRFVAGVIEGATELGEEVAGRVASVLDFVSRELAPIVKDVPPRTPPDDRKPAPTIAARRPNPPVVPAIPPKPILSATARANLEALERKRAQQAASGAGTREATPELRAVADKVLRGETLDVGELQRFVEACRFVTLDEQLSNAFTEAQDHLKSIGA
jgi:hypothetical protein